MTATLTAAAMLSALRKGADFAVTVNALCDLLEEGGHASGRALSHLRGLKRRERWACESLEERCVNAKLVTWDDCPCQREAADLHAAAAAVDLESVAVLSTGRAGRKDKAVAARTLFAKLGMKGVSVTTPNYSMASGVEVKLPKRLDVVKGGVESASGRRSDCPASVANRECERKVGAILLAAFPDTDDRSDSQTDYFDCFWSIN